MGWSLFFLLYFAYRATLRRLAAGRLRERPAALLLAAYGWGVLWFAVSFLAPLALTGLSALVHPAFAVLFGMGSCALDALGLLGWVVLGIVTIVDMFYEKVYRKAHPLPKLQFYIQDAYMALLLYGLGMTLTTALLPERDTYWVAVLAFALGTSAASGLYAALDACRRNPPFESIWRRLAFVGCVVLGFMVLLPVGYAAWRSWRRALWYVERPKPVPTPTTFARAVETAGPAPEAPTGKG